MKKNNKTIHQLPNEVIDAEKAFKKLAQKHNISYMCMLAIPGTSVFSVDGSSVILLSGIVGAMKDSTIAKNLLVQCVNEYNRKENKQ